MSERNEFDDLARRKLEEREFNFNEADWLEAQRLIALQRSSGTWRTWLVAGVGLALIGTSAWFVTSDRSAVQGTASVSVITTNEKSTSPTLITAQEQPKAIERARSSAPSDGTVSVDLSNNAVPTRSSGSSTDADGPGSGVQREPVSLIRHHRTPERAILLEHATASPSLATTDIVATPQDPPQAPDPIESNTSEEEVAATASMPGEPDIDLIAPATPTEIADTEAGNVNVDPGTEPPVLSRSEPSVATIQNRTTYPPADEVRANSVEPLPDDTSTTIPTAAEETNDQTQIQDSASTAATVPPPPPLITPDPPWEISVLFGGLLSNSTYTGGNSAEWIDGQTGRWSPAFGGEVMHMGRNFGIGSGLHYSTYQEDLHIAERSLTTTVIQDSNYFQPFQTTILYVIGSVVIDGEQYYVTESRDTTLNMLVLGTISHTTTRKLIDAWDVTNRVSYLEVPLLLDAHVVQGAWALGVRGGPTIGLLNGRRGAVPNAAFDGYTDLATEQFRSPVVGFTARVYLRYRCVSGWSIGLEPTWRGHFGNVLNSDDLTRKSSALGGMISVSYRLR